MAATFDPAKRPEENVRNFFSNLKALDPDLGTLLEARLQSGAELTPRQRAAIAREAVAILTARTAGANNG